MTRQKQHTQSISLRALLPSFANITDIPFCDRPNTRDQLSIYIYIYIFRIYVSVDPLGSTYTKGGRVLRFTSNGLFIQVWGAPVAGGNPPLLCTSVLQWTRMHESDVRRVHFGLAVA